MRVGQPKLSERNTQGSWLFVTPTKREGASAVEFFGLRLKDIVGKIQTKKMTRGHGRPCEEFSLVLHQFY